MNNKKFALQKELILPLVTGYGGCIATDMITVQGEMVGYMIREFPLNSMDSGWLFSTGMETQEYMDNPQNHGVYDVNTIANYCTDIIPHLDAPPQSAFIRDKVTGQFIQVPYQEPLD